MGIAGVNTQIRSNSCAENKTNIKSRGNSGTLESFKEAVADWEKRIKEKNDKDLKNDSENNIHMSDKQWQHLLNKVDGAIGALKEEQTEEKQSPEKEESADSEHSSQLLSDKLQVPQSLKSDLKKDLKSIILP